MFPPGPTRKPSSRGDSPSPWPGTTRQAAPAPPPGRVLSRETQGRRPRQRPGATPAYPGVPARLEPQNVGSRRFVRTPLGGAPDSMDSLARAERTVHLRA